MVVQKRGFEWVLGELKQEGSLVVAGSEQLLAQGVFETQGSLLESPLGQTLFNQLSEHFVVCQIHLKNVQEDESLNALRMHTIFFRGISAVHTKAQKSGKPLLWLLSVDRQTYEGKVHSLISCVARLRKEFKDLRTLMLVELSEAQLRCLGDKMISGKCEQELKEELLSGVATFVQSFIKNKSVLQPFAYAHLQTVSILEEDHFSGLPVSVLKDAGSESTPPEAALIPTTSGSSEKAISTTQGDLLLPPMVKVFLLGFGSALLLLIFMMYLKAPFMVQLSDILWGCS